VIFSAAHPQVLRIMSHEGAIDSPRVRFVVDRFVNPLRPGVERLLARLVAAGRIRPVPYATLHYLITAGGGALFANPVEAALLGAPTHPDAQDIHAHAEAVADLLIAGIAMTPPTADAPDLATATADAGEGRHKKVGEQGKHIKAEAAAKTGGADAAGAKPSGAGSATGSGPVSRQRGKGRRGPES
jgi:hypothetical protein